LSWEEGKEKKEGRSPFLLTPKEKKTYVGKNLMVQKKGLEKRESATSWKGGGGEQQKEKREIGFRFPKGEKKGEEACT